MILEALKPCPFCGNSDVMIHAVVYEKTPWIISCDKCKCEFTVSREYTKFCAEKERKRYKSNHDAVVNVWNSRFGNE